MHGIKDYFQNILVIVLLQFFSVSLLSAAHAGEIYRWKDKNGNVFFSDVPPAVGDAEVITLKEERAPNAPVRPKVNAAMPQVIKTDQKRPYSSIKVIMYTTSWCGYCRKAKEYLRSLSVDLVEYDIERDRSLEAEMLRKSGGARGVPLIDVEGIIIHGYSPDQMKDAVEKRRSL
ncbi:MAG TPA: glutaredoxin domain-containing protein [Thermodesulfobacteriota bacterium]|nr:glutaredoxin domain-containing protein [Thermodesulfobacteriota bacterium]